MVLCQPGTCDIAKSHDTTLCTENTSGVEQRVFPTFPVVIGWGADSPMRSIGTFNPALLVHGHLDVVPADPAEWSVHPFSGEERDGYVWGRGAVDMKDMDAMVLALVRDWAQQNAINLPEAGQYGVAMCFLPQGEEARTYAIQHFERLIAKGHAYAADAHVLFSVPSSVW